MASASPDESVLDIVLRLLPPITLLILAYHVLGRLEECWRLRHFKGPATTGLSWWWHSRAVFSGKSHEFYGSVTEKYAVFELFRQFDFALTDPTKPWETYNSLGLFEIRNMWVDVTSRE